MGTDDDPTRRTGSVTDATAPGASPTARELFRRGAIYGLAGVLRAADVTVAAARGAVRGAKEGAASASGPCGPSGTQKNV